VGKIDHREIEAEPLAIYDRIDQTYQITELPLIVAHSGISHESGQVHGKLREIYMRGNESIKEQYEELATLAWKSRFALMRHDWRLLGKYFHENTRLMNKIMQEAEFDHGIGAANNILIEIVKDDPDFYGIKLTGAGGGGSVFALVNQTKINELAIKWEKRLQKVIEDPDLFESHFPDYPSQFRLDLINAKFYLVKIADGVKQIYCK
jgi:mevalonate kinase